MRLGMWLMGVAGSGLVLLAVSSTSTGCGGGNSDLFGSSVSKEAGVGGSSAAGQAGSGNGGTGATGNGGTGATGNGGTGATSNGGTGATSNGGTGATGNGGTGATGNGGAGGSSGCTYTDSTDHDGDGWSFADGDCNDCDPSVNPGAFDGAAGVGKAGVDDDCNGTPDNELAECDVGWALDDPDPVNGAKAMGLCALSSASGTGSDRRWGVLSAKYVKADGMAGMNALSHGLMAKFGAANAQRGVSMLVLSSGTARAPNQPGFQAPDGAQMGTTSGAPSGYPKGSTLCPPTTPGVIKDPAALEVQVRVPTNAKGLGFDFNFYSFEFPVYVCSQFNDQFVAILSPNPPSIPDGNLAYDTASNAISVNINLLQVCNPQTPVDGGMAYPCPLGNALLVGTGFESHSATGWLHSQAPVTAGSTITLRIAIWDAGDDALDSTVLLDKFEWLPDAVSPSTTPVVGPK